MELDNLQKKIVLVSSGQPSLNPRLIKEADTLANAGYEVTVLYAYWNDWGAEHDKKLLPSKKWKAKCVGGDPEQKPLIYFLSRLIHKISVLISKKKNNSIFTEFAISRSSFFLLSKAKKYKADLYIGHNLGALPATVKAAKINQKKNGFDAEDFHRNEFSNDPINNDVILKSYIENKYIPQVNYLSVSSPGIATAYQRLFVNVNPVVLLNAFPIAHSISSPLPNEDRKLRLFWFSQTIGPERGLEDIVQALTVLNSPDIELHLLGDLPPSAKTYLTEIGANAINLHIYHPISQDEIDLFASQFDIGLALEIMIPYNRDICLTNKIFTYVQAGLAVIASNTSAQKELLTTYPDIGKVYEKGNIRQLINIIENYHSNRNGLLQAKIAAYNAARETLNWETESIKFLETVAAIL